MGSLKGSGARIIKVLVLVAVLAGVVYWFRLAPLSVTGVRVSRGAVIAEVMGTGTLEARVQTVLSSKIPGRITEIAVDQGDRVKAEDVLARLDDKELRQQVEIARSTVSAAQASIDRVEAESRRSQALMDQIRAEHQRQQRLFASKAISPNEMEKSDQARAVAEADVARARAAMQEARKNLLVAQNTLDYHVARLHDTVIRSPFDGLIARRDREPGDVVVPGTSILLLISTEALWVRAWVDETEMSKVAAEQPARVHFRSEPEQAYPGKVVRLARETDRETRQLIVDVEVERLPANWAVGQRADVFIRTGERKDVLAVPSRLLVRQKEQAGVFVEKAGRAEWRPIRLGLQGREKVEVLSGLADGDTVITNFSPASSIAGRKVSVGYHESRR
ncbi:MAG: efflux RND transporter periplasmic adaptor subunit [Thermodesulfobacteriota bacterium]